MRKVKLTLEKHLLPSKDTPLARHEAQLLFDWHDTLVDHIRIYRSFGLRNPKRQLEAVLIKSAVETIGSLASYEINKDEGIVEGVIRTSARERIAKVLREAFFILEHHK